MKAVDLHSMARRYLIDRHTELSGQHAMLPNHGRAPDGYHHSLEAKNVFPRYNVVAAMLVEVERLDADRLPEPETLAAELIRAAAEASSPATETPHDRIEADAIDAERRLFADAVRTWTSGVGPTVEPLPYRRVLTAEESSDWRTRLESRWGVRGLVWHPMLAVTPPDDVLVLREVSMWDGPGVRYVRRALAELGRDRLVELREYGPDHLLAVDLFSPTYTGAEGMWSDDTLDWLAFASHEGTVAIGGSLAAALPASWQNLDDWRWAGW